MKHPYLKLFWQLLKIKLLPHRLYRLDKDLNPGPAEWWWGSWRIK
jgi:hypothetical protein